MAPSITIVVTCSDRKSLPAREGLRFRDVPPGTSVERALDWRKRLRLGGEQKPLSSLYKGEQWKESLRLAGVARRAGYEPRLLVASAGLGLQSLEATAPGYAATFALGNPDAVADTVEEAAAWWAQVADFSPYLDLAALDGRALLVLSRNYALPLADDLVRLGSAGSDTVLVGGAAEIPGVARVPSDATLRSALGGTLSSLNQRMAIRFLELSDGPSDWLSDAHLRRWDTWAANSRQRELFDRRRGGDDEIKAWIRAMVAQQSISATKALREYRSQGYACEQGRFGRLYREVVMGSDPLDRAPGAANLTERRDAALPVHIGRQ